MDIINRQWSCRKNASLKCSTEINFKNVLEIQSTIFLPLKKKLFSEPNFIAICGRKKQLVKNWLRLLWMAQQLLLRLQTTKRRTSFHFSKINFFSHSSFNIFSFWTDLLPSRQLLFLSKWLVCLPTRQKDKQTNE